MIATHQIKPGERINFSVLEKLFNVSRVPLREAVQRLMSRGLILSESQKGYYVVALTHNDIRDIYKARIMLETLSVERSINKIPQAELQSLREFFRDKLNHLRHETEQATLDLYEADWKLHFTFIIGCSNSKVFNQLKLNLIDFADIARHFDTRVSGGIEDHIKIIDALLEKNVKSAKRAITNHIKNVEKEVDHTLEKLRLKEQQESPQYPFEEMKLEENV